MTFSVTLGWWLMPLALAIALFAWALWDRPSEHGGFIPHPAPLLRFIGAVVGSLMGVIVYLIWRLAIA